MRTSRILEPARRGTPSQRKTEIWTTVGIHCTQPFSSRSTIAYRVPAIARPAIAFAAVARTLSRTLAATYIVGCAPCAAYDEVERLDAERRERRAAATKANAQQQAAGEVGWKGANDCAEDETTGAVVAERVSGKGTENSEQCGAGRASQDASRGPAIHRRTDPPDVFGSLTLTQPCSGLTGGRLGRFVAPMQEIACRHAPFRHLVPPVS